MATMVQLLDNAFHAAMNTRVKTVDYLVTHLDECLHTGFPAMPSADVDEVTMVSTRQLMYLPAKYAALMMHTTGCTFRVAWEILYRAIIDGGDL
jgi:hypothetical protein